MQQLKEEEVRDLLSRFYVNLPASEIEDINRRFYHLEQAYWFHLDFRSGLPAATIAHKASSAADFAHFATQLLRLAHRLGHGLATEPPPNLRVDVVRAQYETYLEHYKYQIPVAGCVLLAQPPTPTQKPSPPTAPRGPRPMGDEADPAGGGSQRADSQEGASRSGRPGSSEAGGLEVGGRWYALMVKGVNTPNLGFTKGKVNRGETLQDAAVREVYEEVGLELAPFREGAHAGWSAGRATFFPVTRGVPFHFPYAPRCRGEIESVVWVPVVSLDDLTAMGIRLTRVAATVWPHVLHHVATLPPPSPDHPVTTRAAPAPAHAHPAAK